MQSLRTVDADSGSFAGDLLSIYTFNPDKKRWCRAAYQDRRSVPSALPSAIQILTWNVNFLGARISERLQCAIEHIQLAVFRCTDEQAPQPCVLLLQEIEAEVIPVLLGNTWVRNHFQVTPISKFNWPGRAHYGNITLVARSIPVLSASSLVFANSHMSRNALIVDLQLGEPKAEGLIENATVDASETRIVRVANVHLESLPQGAKARPEQLALVAKALKETGLFGGVVGGDMNAILESDIDTPKEVGVRDAYTGADDDVEGHTWGYQPICAFPPGRLDKILYTPGTGFVGVRTGRGDWVSDHYGLLTTFSIHASDE
ncbi:Endonuclease/exonuclease/phosphatase [Phellopilus nigrolimitatus]|nr:Endonuclease/exonuclease/phosphatase [Phellopilus nigrolimitatus]